EAKKAKKAKRRWSVFDLPAHRRPNPTGASRETRLLSHPGQPRSSLRRPRPAQAKANRPPTHEGILLPERSRFPRRLVRLVPGLALRRDHLGAVLLDPRPGQGGQKKPGRFGMRGLLPRLPRHSPPGRRIMSQPDRTVIAASEQFDLRDHVDTLVYADT